MANQIKTIVLVHGAFADGSCWAKVIPLLTAKGFKAVAVQNPLSTLVDDVKAAHRAIEMQDGPVLLVGHSWGGAVITEAGNHPQVAGLLYVAAAATDSGQSFNNWWKDYPPKPSAAQIRPYGKDCAAFTQEGFCKYLAQDLSTEEADVLWAVQGPIGVVCFDNKISQAAWRNKPA